MAVTATLAVKEANIFCKLSTYHGPTLLGLRQIKGRKWDGTSNIIPIDFAEELINLLTDQHIAISWVQETSTQTLVQKKVEGTLRAVKLGLALKTEYNPKLAKELAALPGTLSKRTSIWRFGSDPYTAMLLQPIVEKYGIKDEANLAGLVEGAQRRIDLSYALDAELGEVPTIGGFNLLPYQRAGVKYAIEAKRGFIGDSMGLGKSVQASATLIMAKALPAIVVCPAIAKLNWVSEIEKFWGLENYKVAVQFGKATDKRLLAQLASKGVAVIRDPSDWALIDFDIGIINYDVLDSHSPFLSMLSLKGFVADEIHYLANPGSLRSQAAHLVASGVSEVALGLSGTIITSKPEQLISQLEVLGLMERLGGKSLFRDRYAPFATNGKITPKRAEELHNRLRSFCYVRRRSQDVYKDLPDPMHITVRVEGDPKELSLYKSLEVEMMTAAKEGKSIFGATKPSENALSAMDKMAQMNRALGSAKISHAVRWISDFLEDTDEKILVFAHHVAVVEGVAKALKVPFINGKTSLADRQRIQKSFQEQPDSRVVVANMQAAGIALTLTAATHILFVEMDFTPAVHQQAIARAYGRANDLHGVMVHWMIVPDTLDEKMLDIVARKGQMAAAVIDGDAEAGDGSIYANIYKFYMGQAEDAKPQSRG